MRLILRGATPVLRTRRTPRTIGLPRPHATPISRAARQPARALRVPRGGVALVELLVALVLTTIVGGTLVRLLDRTQRHAHGLAIESDQRAQLGVAAAAITGAVQGASATDGDLVAGSDSSLAYLAPVGVGLACALGPTSLDLPPTVIASGALLTWWNTSPQAGDTVAILDEGVALSDVDDRWRHAVLVSVTPALGACLGTPWLDPVADAGRVGWRLTLGDTLPATVTRGAPLRVLRPERLALYRSGTEWMLGWTEWNAATAAWHAIQPVAGPLLPWAPPGATSGLAFQWHDSLGSAVALAPAPVAPPRWLELGVGGITRRQLRHDGVAIGLRRDSITLRVPLPNSP